MSDSVKINLHLEWKGLTLQGFPWPEQRKFYDAFVTALVAMDAQLTPNDIVPVEVKGGSAMPSFLLPRANRAAVGRLQRGENRTWSSEQRRSAARLYSYLGERNATMSMGIRKLKLLAVPNQNRSWTIRELTTVTAVVLRVGGTKGVVELRFDRDGHQHCKVGRPLAQRFAGHLYQRVELYGLSERDPTTSMLLNFDIRSFEPVQPKAAVPALAELHKLLGDSMDDFDPIAHLHQLRG